MQVSKSFVAFATTALVAFLAGCSGGSQFAPAQSGSATQSVNRAPARDASRGVQASLTGGPAVMTSRLSDGRFVSTGIKPNKTVPQLFLSDNPTGNVDQFNEDKPNALVATCAGCGGWGLAVSPDKLGATQLLAIGKSGGSILIYDTLPTPTLISTLTTSGGNAYGICFDGTGGIYSTDFGASTNVDYFTKAQVLGAGGGPTTTLHTTALTDARYTACDYDKLGSKGENYVMVNGFTGAGTDGVEELLPVDALVNTVAGPNGSFPGGLALDKKDDLIVNDQYGAMFDLGNKEPWKAHYKASCTWGFNPNDYTNIAFDDVQNEIWAADPTFAGVTMGVSNKYKFAGGNKACAPGPSGGPTATQSGEAQYLGVAVWPNGGV
jgi:hypothetical protein